VLEVGDGVFEVKATNGDTFLGGEDFDKRIMDTWPMNSKKESGIDLRTIGWRCSGSKTRQKRPNRAVERDADRSEPAFITADQNGPKHLSMKLTRASLRRSWTTSFKERCHRARRAQGRRLAAAEIGEVVLVGGQTRMPRCRRRCKAFLGASRTRRESRRGRGRGAAIQAGVLQGDVKDVLLLDVTPLSLGIDAWRRYDQADRSQHDNSD